MNPRVFVLIAIPAALVALYVAIVRRNAAGESAAPGAVGALDALASAGESVMSTVDSTIRKIFTPPTTAAPYLETIRAAEQSNGIPDSLLARLLYQESRFRPDIITGKTKSPVGALGIAQFMPATARDLGIDPLNPYDAIDGAARYLRSLYDKLGGDWSRALAAYNWGIGNVQRKGLAQAPAETVNYVNNILSDVEV